MLPLGASMRDFRFTALSKTNPSAPAQPGTKEDRSNSVSPEIRLQDNRRTIVLNARLFDGYPVLIEVLISISRTDKWLNCHHEINLQHSFDRTSVVLGKRVAVSVK